MTAARSSFVCNACFQSVKANNSQRYRRLKSGALVAVCEKCEER